MSTTKPKESNLYILRIKDKYLKFIQSSHILKTTKKSVVSNNYKKWKNNYLIIDSNDFLILPLKLPNYLKKINIEKTLGVEKNMKKKTSTLTNIKFLFFYALEEIPEPIKKVYHISEILIKEFQENNNSSDKETYIVLLNSKLHICIVENKDLIFYNQFEYTKDNYLKYILLTFEEFKLDRNVSKLNIVDSNENFRKVKKEMKMYFKNINLYKKSIFEIIESHYE